MECSGIAGVNGSPVWHKMPGFYKFLSKQDVEKVLNGSLQFGHANKYRLLEILSQVKGTGDKGEGLKVSHVQDEYKESWRIIDVSRISIQDCYILCLSYDYLDKLIIGIGKFLGPYSYDACLHIYDVRSLIERIGSAQFKDKTVKDYFDIFYDHCHYSIKNEVNSVLHMDDAVESDIFEKSYEFNYQREFRIVLYPKKPMARNDNITINIGYSGEIIKNIHTGIKSKNIDLFSIEEQDALLLLSKIYRKWNDLFPDPGNSDIEEMRRFHEENLSSFGRAYGSLRFWHKRSSRLLDDVLITPARDPGHIYRALGSFLRFPDYDRPVPAHA